MILGTCDKDGTDDGKSVSEGTNERDGILEGKLVADGASD